MAEHGLAGYRDLGGEWRHLSAMPDQIIWGPASRWRLRDVVRRLGCSRVVLLASRSLDERSPWVGEIRENLGHLLVGFRADSQQFTPDWLCFEAAEWARALEPDLVATVGGGSVADWGKAVRFILAQGLRTGEELDAYVASPDRQHLDALDTTPIGQVAVPTTLSGSESSWSVTINRPARLFKDHVRHRSLVAAALIYDAEMAASTPVDLWCATGLKAMEHAVEKMYTVDRNPIVDTLCVRAAQLLYENLPRCAADPNDVTARTLCQLALIMVRVTGWVHKGLSQVIGWQLGAYGVAHGHTACVILPHAMRFNAAVSQSAQAALGRALGGRGRTETSQARHARGAISDLVQTLGLPTRLRDVGVGRDELPVIAEKVLRSPNIIFNPRPVRDTGEILTVLEEAW